MEYTAKTDTVLFKANYGTGTLSLIEHDIEGDKIIIRNDDDKCTVIAAAGRDQFGVWLGFEGFGIAQEDDTGSFIDAYIQALTIMKGRNEFTNQCKVTEPYDDSSMAPR